MTALLSEQPLAELELRNQIAYALSNAGAFCGECGFEPGDRGKCTDCERCWTGYANALLPLFASEQASLELEERESAHQRAERIRLNEEAEQLQVRVTALEAERDALVRWKERLTEEVEEFEDGAQGDPSTPQVALNMIQLLRMAMQDGES